MQSAIQAKAPAMTLAEEDWRKMPGCSTSWVMLFAIEVPDRPEAVPTDGAEEFEVAVMVVTAGAVGVLTRDQLPAVGCGPDWCPYADQQCRTNRGSSQMPTCSLTLSLACAHTPSSSWWVNSHTATASTSDIWRALTGPDWRTPLAPPPVTECHHGWIGCSSHHHRIVSPDLWCLARAVCRLRHLVTLDVDAAVVDVQHWWPQPLIGRRCTASNG